MSASVLFDRNANRSCLYCNTDDRAFGPVFVGDEATDFLEWMVERQRDPREMNANTLDVWVRTWQVEVEAVVLSTAVAKRDAVQEIVATIDRPEFQQQLAEMIPPGLSLETFTRHAKLAIQLNPELVGADRPSLFLAMVKGAASGLLPDGRESAFVVVGKKVQWWAMIAGLRRKAAEHGITLAASVVYANDEFSYTTMPPDVKHAPVTLGQERGEPLGAWAAALDADGRMICPPVVMSVAEIDKVKASSRGASSEYSPWVKWWDRMACKTVARRLFAEMPLADQARAEIDRTLNAEVDRGAVEQSVADVPALANLPILDVSEEYEPVEGEVVDDDGQASFTEMAKDKGLV